MDAAKGTLGILVVGAGFIGARRAAAVHAARGTKLVGVVDRDPARARAVARRYDVFASTDLEEGLEFDGVDAVVVATPNSDHVGTIEQALVYGKHVLCDLPLAIDADDAWRLARHADDVRLRLAVGSPFRFVPPIRDALAIVRDWGIGRIESLRVRLGRRATSDDLDSWRNDRERSGGGSLIDLGPHGCDLIRRFLGEVEAVTGYLRHEPGEILGCERESFGLFRNHDHAVAELRTSWNRFDVESTLEIQGFSGFLRIETAPWSLSGRTSSGKSIRRSYRAERIVEAAFERRRQCSRAMVEEVESFAAPDGGYPRRHATGWDGFRAAEMVQALYESDRKGKEISIAAHLTMPSHVVADAGERVA